MTAVPTFTWITFQILNLIVIAQSAGQASKSIMLKDKIIIRIGN